ncbi:unnamed protein product [Lepeophtheirus salmonis]|uniref:(salmon louse) hypothetical protein n=1 Tax=Lepeophtheirus salmonis TaxID=72036 RepID=A0A7R8D4Y2_LEPSM|nr:unnamed protein product [Lepeophtheirus salmonis]CAF3029801.1 unnamed protein product [Lepeophtheirus salmonis]
MVSKAKLAVSQREDTLEESREAKKNIDIIAEQTKILQNNITSDISKRYKNRKVNIMGGIQSCHCHSDYDSALTSRKAKQDHNLAKLSDEAVNKYWESNEKARSQTHL